VHYLTKSTYAPVLEGNPYVDKILSISQDIGEVTKELREIQYNHVVDLHNNLRSFRVKGTLRRPSSAFHKLNVEKWLMTNFRIDRLPDKHIVDRYFGAVDALGVRNDGEGLDFFITRTSQVDVATVSDGRITPGAFIALAIGAGIPTKNLEDWQWTDLVCALKWPVILLGGPDDTERGTKIADQSETCINMAGKLTIQQSASLIQQASVLISPDTGLMHIAAALKKPVISVWGNTIPKFGMTPYYPAGMQGMSRIFETPGLSCRPCSKIGYKQCPQGHFRCIRSLDIDAIASTANGMMR
jgi:ADP-heptose:LPS heptosyltransferase